MVTHTATPATAELDRPSGRAVRFLLAHRLARLLTTDPITREPYVSPVHYVADEKGDLLTLLPADSAHARAIRAGGHSVLSVQARHGHVPDPLHPRDTAGADRIWHVQSAVDARLTTNPDAVRDILRRQVHSVLRDLPQHDKSDPILRAPESVIGALIGVRLKLLDVVIREHLPATAPAA